MTIILVTLVGLQEKTKSAKKISFSCYVEHPRAEKCGILKKKIDCLHQKKKK
jgi:hypothetical protein